MEDRLFTIDEISQYLKIPKSTIYKLSQNAELPSCKIGKQLRFRKLSIDKWLTEKEASATKEKAVYAKCILLIDDDKLVLKAVSRFLNMHGYKVEPAESGEQALEKVAKQGIKIDLVITDIRMPGIDGIETIRQIRQLRIDSNKPVIPEIIITGYTDPEIERQAEAMGIVDYIYKPFANSEFMEVVGKKVGLN